MPLQSAPRCRDRRGARGFTMVEILVVVVIIGVVAGFVTLTVSATGRDRDLEAERDRMDALIAYVREQAELESREYGLRLSPQAYEFVRFEPRSGAWSSELADDTLRRRELPAGLEFHLKVESRPVVLAATSKVDEPVPQVMLMSNGDLTSFALSLYREGTDRHADIASDADGVVTKSEIIERPP